MTDPHRDRECLQRVQAKDTQALAELYDRHTPLLFPVALRIVGDAGGAEDALHDAWMDVWRRAGSYDPRRGAVTAWLISIVRSLALDRRRLAAGRSAGAAPSLAATPTVDPGTADAAPSPAGQRAREALAGLDPPQRAALELAYFEGLSQSDIAVRLGSRPDAVRSWTRSGLAQLRELLPQEEWS